MKRTPHLAAVALAIVSLLSSTGCKCPIGSKAPKEGALTAPVISQTVVGFYRPESSTFSLDGRFLYVTNCGSGFYGVDAKGEKQFSLAHEKGAVSKLSVAEDGTLTMINAHFYPKTSGALGISTLPIATETFPAGTLLFNSGFFMQTDANDRYIDNQKEIDPAIVIIDPDSAKLLGKISLAMDGELCKAIGNPIFIPNGLCFDHEGNLYFAETGATNPFLKGAGEVTSKSGVVKIPHAAIDALAAGKPAEGLKFLEAPSINGVGFDRETDTLFLLTFSGAEAGDSLYKVTRKEFEAGILPKPFVTGQGRLDGVVVTPGRDLLVTDVTNKQLLKIDPAGKVERVSLGGKGHFEGPSDIKMRLLKDGTPIVILPEQEFTAPKEWTQRVHVIRLPVGY